MYEVERFKNCGRFKPHKVISVANQWRNALWTDQSEVPRGPRQKDKKNPYRLLSENTIFSLVRPHLDCLDWCTTEFYSQNFF